MLYLPALAHLVAQVTRREPTIVTFAARTLRKAGLFEETKRGRGAAPMTAREAAMLVLAVAGMTEAKDSAATIKRYWRLAPRPVPPGAPDEGPPAYRSILETRPALAPLGAITRFGEAVEFLITNSPALDGLTVAIRIRRPEARGTISLMLPASRQLWGESYFAPKTTASVADSALTDHYETLVLGAKALATLHHGLSGVSEEPAK